MPVRFLGPGDSPPYALRGTVALVLTGDSPLTRMSCFVHARWGWVLSLLCAVAAAHLYSAPSPTVRFVPDDLGNPNWVSALRAMQPIQARALAGVQAFHDFQFTDRLRESGVTFRNRS